MNFKNFVYFVLERNSNASYSFNGYTDQATGELKVIHKGRMTKDRLAEVPHRFKFDRAHRSIRVHKDEVDKYGNSIVEFLRNFPECKDSPNGAYRADEKGKQTQTNIWFKEIKAHEDAITAIDAKKVQLDASNIAMALEGSDLHEMAILFDCANEDESIARHAVLENAAADPSRFLALYSSPVRSAKSLLTRAVDQGEVIVKGTIYTWKDQTLGVSEDFAISKLVKETELAAALSENMKLNGTA